MNRTDSRGGIRGIDDRTARHLRALARAIADESGVTAVEYGLIASLILVACLAGMGSMSAAFNALWTNWVIPVITALVG